MRDTHPFRMLENSFSLANANFIRDNACFGPLETAQNHANALEKRATMPARQVRR